MSDIVTRSKVMDLVVAENFCCLKRKWSLWNVSQSVKLEKERVSVGKLLGMTWNDLLTAFLSKGNPMSRSSTLIQLMPLSQKGDKIHFYGILPRTSI